MIQDIAPLSLDISFHKDEMPLAGDRLLIFRDNEVLIIKEGEQVNIPCFHDIMPYWPHIENDTHYLFSIGKENSDKENASATKFFLVDESRVNILLPQHFAMTNINIFRDFSEKYISFAAVTAHHLYQWHKHTRFCGCCGMEMRDSSKERARVCPNCGNTVYPNIAPAVIVAITDGSRLLMAKNAVSPYRHYALIAGFVEVGETFEDAVRREVMEEVGIKVKNVRYYKSQPWSFSFSEMIGFFAELDGDDTVTLGDGELSEALWFPYDEIPPNAMRYKDFSIAQEMIDLVRENKHGSHKQTMIASQKK